MSSFQDLLLPLKVYRYLTSPDNKPVVNQQDLISIHSCTSKWDDFQKCVTTNESKNCQSIKNEFEKCINQLN